MGPRQKYAWRRHTCVWDTKKPAHTTELAGESISAPCPRTPDSAYQRDQVRQFDATSGHMRAGSGPAAWTSMTQFLSDNEGQTMVRRRPFSAAVAVYVPNPVIPSLAKWSLFPLQRPLSFSAPMKLSLGTAATNRARSRLTGAT